MALSRLWTWLVYSNPRSRWIVCLFLHKHWPKIITSLTNLPLELRHFPKVPKNSQRLPWPITSKITFKTCRPRWDLYPGRMIETQTFKTFGHTLSSYVLYNRSKVCLFTQVATSLIPSLKSKLVAFGLEIQTHN